MRRSRIVGAVVAACAAGALAGTGCSGGHHSGGFYASSTAAGSTAQTSSQSATSPGSTAPGSTQAPSGPVPTYGTRHCWPIVLVHGFGGFKNLGPLEYWYHIPEDLRAHGYEVFVVSDTPVSTAEDRAKELRDQILAQYPDPRVKVNLVGHSMGGLDCRYAVSSLGLSNKVASVTTIGTPNRGSSVADVIFGLVPGPLFDMLNILCNLVGYDLNGGKELTTVYATQTFNPQNPDAPGVAYFSWAGVADPTGAQTGCAVEPFFIPSWSILSNLEGPNDGLVSVASAKWGTFMGTVPADHYNEVGQPMGLGPFDQLRFFEDWADQLEARGFGP